MYLSEPASFDDILAALATLEGKSTVSDPRTGKRWIGPGHTWRGIGRFLNWVSHITMPWTLRCDHPAPPLMSPMGLTREGGEEPHRRSRRCDMRPTEWHRINSIVAPTIVVGNQTGTFDLLIPKPASSVSDSDKTPGFSGFGGLQPSDFALPERRERDLAGGLPGGL